MSLLAGWPRSMRAQQTANEWLNLMDDTDPHPDNQSASAIFVPVVCHLLLRRPKGPLLSLSSSCG